MADNQQKVARIVYRAGTKDSPSFYSDKTTDEAWLVTNPKLYFPLGQDLPEPLKKHLEGIYLWQTDVSTLSKDFSHREKCDGLVIQVELNKSKNSKNTFKEILASLKWEKTTVPQCDGGLSLMNFGTLVLAVIVYMGDHFPKTPEELNFHAELKAASQWYWSNDHNQLVMKEVLDNCRLKIAVRETLETWKDEEKDLQEKLQSTKDSDSSDVDEELADVREAIEVLKNYLGDDKRVVTHFLSFTLDRSGMQKRVDDFKKEVSKDCFECGGIEAIMFQPETKIHLTFGTKMWLSDSDVEKAKKIWSKCCEELVSEHLQDGSVYVELKGVEYVNDDHAGFGVLYAKVTTKYDYDRLQNLADGLVEKFVAHGLMKEEYGKVNIRAPLMKCNLLTESAAIKIHKSFEDFSFGKHQLTKITIGSCDAVEPYDCVEAYYLLS